MKRLFFRRSTQFPVIALILFHSYTEAKGGYSAWSGQATEGVKTKGDVPIALRMDKRATEGRVDVDISVADESASKLPQESPNNDKMTKRIKRALTYAPFWTGV